jgi:hypothetical protein
MTAVVLAPLFNGAQFFDNSGNPLAGGLIKTCAAGSTTSLLTSYTTAAADVPNSNPIVLDSSGRLGTDIWLRADRTYNFLLCTKDGVVLDSVDNVLGTGVATGSGATLPEPFIGHTTQAGTFNNLVYLGNITQDNAAPFATVSGNVTLNVVGWYKVTLNVLIKNVGFYNDVQPWVYKLAAFGTTLDVARIKKSSMHSTAADDGAFSELAGLGLGSIAQTPGWSDTYIVGNTGTTVLAPAYFCANYQGNQQNLSADVQIIVEQLSTAVPPADGGYY